MTINDAAEAFGQMVFGHSPREMVAQGKCSQCAKPVGEFKDELSVKENSINGFCQVCQDNMYEGGDDD
jgi:hypothetical protein